ncbi:unnamed protein product, partial [Aphanomyces euteiches]
MSKSRPVLRRSNAPVAASTPASMRLLVGPNVTTRHPAKLVMAMRQLTGMATTAHRLDVHVVKPRLP